MKILEYQGLVGVEVAHIQVCLYHHWRHFVAVNVDGPPQFQVISERLELVGFEVEPLVEFVALVSLPGSQTRLHHDLGGFGEEVLHHLVEL